MRTVSIALAMIALVVGAWFATRHNIEPAVVRIPSDVAPVAAAPERGSPSRAVEPEDDSGPVAGDPPTTNTPDNRATGREIPNPYREPEFRDALARYLVESGLSATDSERVADTAVDGLTECVVTSGYDPRAPGSRACESNVLHQAGLDEALHRTALNHAWGSLVRRLALERAAAAARAVPGE